MRRTNWGFKIAVGAYLVYLGYKLITDSIKGKADNYLWFVLAGAVFVIIGAWFGIGAWREHQRQTAADNETANEADTELEAAETISDETNDENILTQDNIEMNNDTVEETTDVADNIDNIDNEALLERGE
ncbi:MAG: hypothetical protein LBQ95_03960 [Lachnospiraceae bacterium]|jgi:hypothetical protein|nr:hypothetical protein [Lachnospiraceae bacterium]